jgi:hypothetical protein
MIRITVSHKDELKGYVDGENTYCVFFHDCQRPLSSGWQWVATLKDAAKLITDIRADNPLLSFEWNLSSPITSDVMYNYL